VVTSRRDLSGLVAEGARPFTVDLLSEAEARRLLARRLGERRVAAEPAAVEEIVVRCGRLPLALTIAAARAATHLAFPLERSAAELRRQGLSALSVGDAATDVRAVFGWSYHALGEAAARLYRWLGLVPGPDVSGAAAASLAGAGYATVARPWLDELIRANLLTEHSPDRFAFHDLLRAYAAELVAAVDEPADRRAALHRLLDHYVHTGHTAVRVLLPQRGALPLPDPRPGVELVELTSRADATAWLTAEYAGIMAALERAVAEGFDAHVVRLAWVLVDFQDTRGLHRDWLATQTTALAAARRLGDRRMEASTHQFLGRANTRLGRLEDAETHLVAGLELFGELGDVPGRATAHHSLALLVGRLGRNADAVHHGQRALELYRSVDHLPGQARAHNTVGWYLCLIGKPAEAVEHCELSLAIHHRTGNTHGEAATWDSLGYVHHTMGDHGLAIPCYEHAVDLLGDADPGLSGAVLMHLGDAYRAVGDAPRARSAWRRALAVLEKIEDPEADTVRVRLAALDAGDGP
jgi:tetratricopeptide (TPR) repeat protein